MALRILLVGLVACLGLEPPSVEEFEGWTASGRGWVAARVADLSNLRVEAGRVLAGADASGRGEEVATDGPVEAASGRVDLAFEAVVEGLALGFADDLLSAGPVPPAGEAVAMTEPGPAIEPDRASVPESPVGPASRLERISTAVSLTRQAVDAWTSLIRPTAERDDGPDQGDAF